MGLEPFARDCLHLFNGEWTVLKYNDQFKEYEPSKEEEKAAANPTRVLTDYGQEFKLITKRNNYHPHQFANKLLIMIIEYINMILVKHLY